MCLLTCPCKGKALFTSYPIKHKSSLRDKVCIIYQNFAIQSQGAHDLSKQDFLNILKCSYSYKGYFCNRKILIAYQRKGQSHSQGTNYKPYTSLRYKSFFHSKIQNIHPISYMFVLYKPKVAPIQLNRSCSMHKWAVQKGEIQERVSPRQ